MWKRICSGMCYGDGKACENVFVLEFVTVRCYGDTNNACIRGGAGNEAKYLNYHLLQRRKFSCSHGWKLPEDFAFMEVALHVMKLTFPRPLKT
ncbi:hypothetical protein HNY73_021985 [Argiope bruennichi]|uniref:Uncharacterized protein n=1 Tax=Argiope bruennichi TaxID=94029 RepID=A0A8T0E333_ARGBR|nr:hypothetical protein HNY73_021985 [Argiope bruennichi]